MNVGAVVLAGGRGSRLGGARKADLIVGGRRLLEVTLAALDGCVPIVVVGEADLVVPSGVGLTREEPPFGGPAAALGAGVTWMGAALPDWVLCLACDQPGVGDAVPALVASALTCDDSIDAWSAGERMQWVCSILRIGPLREAIAAQGELANCSMRRLLGELTWAHVNVPVRATDDIDTWEDHARWLNETI